MTDPGVHATYYFIKPLGSGQTEPLHLDFSYHLRPLYTQPRLDPGCLNDTSPAFTQAFLACAFQLGRNAALSDRKGAPVARNGWSDRRSPQLLMQKFAGPPVG